MMEGDDNVHIDEQPAAEPVEEQAAPEEVLPADLPSETAAEAAPVEASSPAAPEAAPAEAAAVPAEPEEPVAEVAAAPVEPEEAAAGAPAPPAYDESSPRKSTLIKILSGVITATTGEIYMRGRKVDIRTHHGRHCAGHRDHLPGLGAGERALHCAESLPGTRTREGSRVFSTAWTTGR